MGITTKTAVAVHDCHASSIGATMAAAGVAVVFETFIPKLG